MGSSIKALNVQGIGLGPSGFQKLQDLMNGELGLVEINIRFGFMHKNSVSSAV